MTSTGSVTLGTLEELKTIVGESNVIHRDPSRLEAYGRDESGACVSGTADVVVKPTSTAQVSALLRLASRYKLPVTPRGAGSGLAGGAVPVFGGIVLSLEKMNRILEIDPANLVAVVEPGVVTNDLCRAVAEAGLFYAGYPMSVESSFIGGNVACNAGGAKVVKYGATRAHVLGLEVVLPSGEVVELGGKRKKEASGYDLLRLFVGSEGTLGVFTRITLNLIPAPAKIVDLLVPFKTIEDAIYAVPKLMVAAGILPVAVEFIDRLSVKYCSLYTRFALPYQSEADSYLIVQLEGRTREQLQDTYEVVGDACLESGALEVFVADTKVASERLWSMRRNWLEALRAIDPMVSIGDFVVPISEIPSMMRRVAEVAETYQVEIPCAGHAADGNIHPAPLRPLQMSPEEWMIEMKEILATIALAAVDLGGAVSGEHGIGLLKREVLAEAKPQEVEIMRALKRCLDPQGIMNPGKVF